MRNRFVLAAVLAAAMLPKAAAADPVTIVMHSAQNGGTTVLVSPLIMGTPTFMGAVTLPSAGSEVFLQFSGLTANRNYLMELMVHGADSTWNTLRAEVLDPLDGDDGLDIVPYPSGVPDPFSTSHTRDGFSFAQSSGLQRSADFLGGSATVIADEDTNAGDILLFTGVAGSTGPLTVTFGLRDYWGDRSFLVRLSAEDGLTASPEPASMVLIGTGLAGLAALRRRRRASLPS